MQPVSQAAWHAERPLSPTDSIEDELNFPRGAPHVLLTGTVGTGKTTELLRVAHQRAAREFVVFLSLDRHFEEVVGDPAALQEIAPWEICFLGGVALLRAAEDRLSFEFPREHVRALEEAWRALAVDTGAGGTEPEVDLFKLGSKLILTASAAAPAVAGPAGAAVSAGLSLITAAGEGAKWTIPFGRKKPAIPDQDARAQTLIACVNVLIGLVQQRATKVLLVIDGLDRINSVERARELFIFSQMLGLLDCRLVVCGPFVLRHGGAINQVRGFSTVAPLVNVPVLDHDDPSRHGEGIGFFHELFHLRTKDLHAPDLVAAAELDRLAYYSGGRTREFVTFIRVLARLCWKADVDQATPHIVDQLIDIERRKRETGLRTGHLRVLRELVADPEHNLPEDPLALELVAGSAVLPYPNESEWFYPHPLLMIRFVPGKPGSKR
ncbi:hypothetical protein WME94_41050 [Sorangium sp. So ce429]